ncbi:MAG: hypothetical protein GY820_19565, partial [Gammaproteobacteria bacterium]|nr:hypothetical protein [Gammaproteobacteria bacterium]
MKKKDDRADPALPSFARGRSAVKKKDDRVDPPSYRERGANAGGTITLKEEPPPRPLVPAGP